MPFQICRVIGVLYGQNQLYGLYSSNWYTLQGIVLIMLFFYHGRRILMDKKEVKIETIILKSSTRGKKQSHLFKVQLVFVIDCFQTPFPLIIFRTVVKI